MPKSVAVIGSGKGDAFNMRGRAIAEANGWPILSITTIEEAANYDAVVLVKSGLNEEDELPRLRKAAKLLIYDVLDAWSREDVPPEEYFKNRYEEVKFDVILATSPACADVISSALPSANLWMMPHNGDPLCNRDWYAPGGVVIYSGAHRYISGNISQVRKGVRQLKLKFKTARDASVYENARLVLAVRLYPTDTDINRWCKPQAKVENALACGIPVLASDHPCITSLHPWVATIPKGKLSATDWAAAIREALRQPRPQGTPVTTASHAAALKAEIDKL